MKRKMLVGAVCMFSVMLMGVVSATAADKKAYEKGQKENKAQEIQYLSLQDALKQIALERLESRDSDQNHFADIEIEVDNLKLKLKLVDPMAAFLIGDTDQLAGTVYVYDTNTKELLTQFYVDVLKGTGGLLGLAIRGGGVREKLSLQFAD